MSKVLFTVAELATLISQVTITHKFEWAKRINVLAQSLKLPIYNHDGVKLPEGVSFNLYALTSESKDKDNLHFSTSTPGRYFRVDINETLDALGIHYEVQQTILNAQINLNNNNEKNERSPYIKQSTVRMEEIIRTIEGLGYCPTKLPKRKHSNKPWVKSEVRNALGSKGIWSGSTVFNKTWEHLRDTNQIIEDKD